MVPCPTCGTHAVSDDCTCPHCGSKLCVQRPALKTAAAMLLGLSLAGCPPVSEPDYGVTVTTDDSPTTETGDTGTTER